MDIRNNFLIYSLWSLSNAIELSAKDLRFFIELYYGSGLSHTNNCKDMKFSKKLIFKFRCLGPHFVQLTISLDLVVLTRPEYA